MSSPDAYVKNGWITTLYLIEDELYNLFCRRKTTIRLRHQSQCNKGITLPHFQGLQAYISQAYRHQ